MAKVTKRATKKAASKKTTKKTTKKAATKKTTSKKVKLPETFTASSMVSFVAEKHELPKNQAKELVETVFDIIQAGVLAGARVPIGKFGKMYVKVRPARKARKGRNPITGEQITIPAKKATKVPKFTFSKAFKESSLKAKVKK